MSRGFWVTAIPQRMCTSKSVGNQKSRVSITIEEARSEVISLRGKWTFAVVGAIVRTPDGHYPHRECYLSEHIAQNTWHCSGSGRACHIWRQHSVPTLCLAGRQPGARGDIALNPVGLSGDRRGEIADR